MREHLDCLAAENDRRDTATPVRSHHDQIALSRLGGFDNRLIDLFMLDVERVANNTRQLSSIRNDTKHFFGVILGVFPVFDRGVFELARGNREKMEWFGDRHGGNLGTDLLGEEDALLDGFGGEVRPIGRDQDALEHRVLLPAPILSDEVWARVCPWPTGTVVVTSASPESAGDRGRKRPIRASTPPRPIA